MKNLYFTKNCLKFLQPIESRSNKKIYNLKTPKKLRKKT